MPGPELWRRIEPLLDAALDRPPDERQAWVRAACGEDDALFAEVMRFVEACGREAPLFDGDAAAFATDLLARIPVRPGPPPRVGAWRIVDELGHGGMGTVYLAERDEHFQQRAALKLIRRGLHVDPDLVRRFLDERQIVASLEHANIARLLDGGVTDDGVPWFAMEFVDGKPIDRWCDERRLPLDARLRLFCTVCDAVAYAHERQVIHRDLKPSNILVRDDGLVKLLDFGVAKLLASGDDAVEGITRPGVRPLTPEYASPEQIRGGAASPASDVYSLGVLLYELLTGRRPYRGVSTRPDSIEQAVLTQDPEWPSVAVTRRLEGDTETASRIARARDATPERLRHHLQGDLDAIVLEALSKDPQRRYPNVEDLARDLRRHLDGEVVRVGGRARTSRHAFRTAAVLAAVVGGIALWRWWPGTRDGALEPVLAVGLVSDYRQPAPAGGARAIADLLATNLARTPSLGVVSTARIYELMGERAEGDGSSAAYGTAARQAGASMLVEGSLFATDDGGLRLDLRRIAVETGRVLSVYSVTGRDMFALVDTGTARLTSDIGVRAPGGSIADVTTRSEAAVRFYEAGLSAFYRGDTQGARGLFEAAYASDSTFAMAAYYLSHTNPRNQLRFMRRAVELAPRASDRERLVILTQWGLATNDVAALATAESLAVRFPLEPDGQKFAAEALFLSGDHAGALRRLRALLALDSLDQAGPDAPCRRCSARRDVINAYSALDSLDAAEREALAWTRIQPHVTTPWLLLGLARILAGKSALGREAYRQAVIIDPSLEGRPDFLVTYDLADGRYELVDRQLREIIRSASVDRQSEAYLDLGVSLRSQGRFAEALEVYRAYRNLAAAGSPTTPPVNFATDIAQALFDLGRFDEFDALNDSMASLRRALTPAQAARIRLVHMIGRACSLASTGRAREIAPMLDSIRALGASALFAGDRDAHHYVRGLMLSRLGDDAAAVVELRLAISAPVLGDPRVKRELAAALIRLNRPAEAVPVLQPLMHAPLAVTSLNTTRTELEALLARALDAAGARDSALVHYESVLRAWTRPDPVLEDQVRAVRARAQALGGRS